MTLRKRERVQPVRFPDMGCMTVTRIVRERINLEPDRNGCTYGQHVDSYIGMCLAQGDELSEIRLHISEDAWAEMAKAQCVGVSDLAASEDYA